MYQIDRTIYADEGKLLDFKEPHYALNEQKVKEQVHLYTPKLRLGIMDSADNYIEVDKSEVI
jgi:hypothetical protein